MRAATVDAQVGLRVSGRSLWFTDDFFQRLRPYEVVGVAAVAAAVEWYPMQPFTRGPASWFGLALAGDWAPALSSRDAQGRSYGTTAYGFTAGLRFRRVFWRAEAGVTLGYGHQVFAIDRAASEAPPDGIPSVAYQTLRLAASGRLNVVSRLALRATVGYQHVLSSGELGSEAFFPRSTAGCVETELGAAVPLTAGLEARLDLSWKRYFHAMNPVPGDRLVAGGAADDYYAATVGVAIRR